MTVRDLIKELIELPSDYRIFIESEEQSFSIEEIQCKEFNGKQITIRLK